MTLSKKISVTLLFIFAFLGAAYFFKILINLSEDGLNHLFWSILSGAGFAYLLGYKTEITLNKKSLKK
ncbi:MAG: hypothetical protein AB7D28_07445 [Candidatus Berkiella sp.]